MSAIDELMRVHEQEQAKRRNAPHDERTHKLIPELRARFTDRKIGDGTVRLLADSQIGPNFDWAIVKVVKSSINTAEWLKPDQVSMGRNPNILVRARYLPNGKILFHAKNPPGLPETVREFDTPDEVFQAMDTHLLNL